MNHLLPTPAQSAAWAAEQAGMASAFSLAQTSIHSTTDAPALEGIVHTAAARHDAFRMRFDATPNGLVIAMNEHASVAVVHEDLSRSVPSGGIRARLQQIVESEVRGDGFRDLESPRLRVVLVRLPSERIAAILNPSHTICDGMSLAVLTSELVPTPPSGPRRQFSDYLCWREAFLQTTACAELEQRVLQLLEPLSPSEHDFRNETALPFSEGDHAFLRLPIGSPSLRRLCRVLGVTPFVLILAAFQCEIARSTGLGRLVFRTPAVARNPIRDQSIGCFENEILIPSVFETDRDDPIHVAQRTWQLWPTLFASRHLDARAIIDRARLLGCPQAFIVYNDYAMLSWGGRSHDAIGSRLPAPTAFPYNVGLRIWAQPDELIFQAWSHLGQLSARKLLSGMVATLAALES